MLEPYVHEERGKIEHSKYIHSILSIYIEDTIKRQFKLVEIKNT